MTGSEKDQPEEGTRVDLGEDLLERRVAPAPETHERPAEERLPEITDLEDSLQSAQIYLNEGFIDEAKRLFRAILRIDPRHPTALAKLREIQETELKNIFREEQPRRYGRDRRQGTVEPVDSEWVMRQLDKDLQLGIFEPSAASEPQVAELSLFGDKAALDAYAVRLEDEMADATAQDRMDLGIAFLEMGLFEIAVRQFEALRQTILREDEEKAPIRRAAISLLAYTLIRAGRPFEAMLDIEEVIGDPEITPAEKLEFYYLMGRANEKLSRKEVAAAWYGKSARLDPDYRDVRERLKRVSS